MDMQFSLEFYNHKEIGTNFSSFSTSQDELIRNTDKYTYTVNEAQDLRILFNTSEKYNSKLYIELMDMLPEECFNEEESNFFLPSESIRAIYMNQNSHNNPSRLEYPYILPGRYVIKVEVGIRSYFAFLAVNSLRISEKQLVTMRDEVENVIKGLSKQIYKKNMQIDASQNNHTKTEIFYKYDILIRYSNVFLLNLNLIDGNPYFEIKKKYSLKPVDKNVKADLETIKFKQTRRDITHKLKGYEHELDYNIPINKALKFVLETIIGEINQVIYFLDGQNHRLFLEKKEKEKYHRHTEDISSSLYKISLELKKLKQMRSAVNILLSKDWINNIKNVKNTNNLHRLLKRPNYRIFFEIYKELQKDKKKNNNLMNNYLYYWKNTPLLYEIWGFIKMLEVVYSSKYNFTSCSGWIFDTDNKYRVLPFLDSETKISFQSKSGLLFNIYYDSIITRDPKLASIENPLYTVYKHNKPDFRLDVYDKGTYQGSLIADFKYRAMKSLGNENIFKKFNAFGEKTNGFDVYKQLKDYSNFETHYYRTEIKNTYPEKPVKSVWALFPIFEDKTSFLLDKERGSNVRRISLSPGESTEHIKKELEDLVDYYLR